jgi:hypothetical protein
VTDERLAARYAHIEVVRCAAAITLKSFPSRYAKVSLMAVAEYAKPLE